MFLNFKTVRNIRDLGGIFLKEGKIKDKLLLRGGALNNISNEEFDILKTKYNLKTVIDFRSKNSFYSKPDKIDETINYHHYFVTTFLDDNLYTLDMTNFGYDEFLFEVYKHFALDKLSLNAYHNFLIDILNTPINHSVYFHCTSGKDRTGIGATLILFILGASKETIYEEYLRSNEYTINELNSDLKKIKNISRKEYEFLVRKYLVRKEYLDTYFDEIFKKYGTIEKYISEGLKISSKQVEIFKKRYIDYN